MSTLKSLLAITVLAAIAPLAGAQENVEPAPKLPLSTSNYDAVSQQRPLTIPQQRAKFATDQRMLRMEFNNWIGYSPLRPNVNSSYMAAGYQRYYIPSRSGFYGAGNARAWYW